MARIDPTRQVAFEALARRDERRGTGRNGSLLRRRLLQITPRSRVKGIAGYRRPRSTVEVGPRPGRLPLTLGLRQR